MSKDNITFYLFGNNSRKTYHIIRTYRIQRKFFSNNNTNNERYNYKNREYT